MTEPDSQRIHDTIVIGGGMVGISIALELLSRGQRVALIDPGQADQRASYGNAGVISPGSFFPVASPGIWPNLPRYILGRDPALQIRYRDVWSLLPWSMEFLRFATAQAYHNAVSALAPLVAAAAGSHQALATRIGTTRLLNDRGWLRLYRDQTSFERSVSERRLLAYHNVDSHVLDKDQIHELEPALARRFSHAVFLPQALSVEQPGRLVQRCHQTFRESGGDLIESRATDLLQTDSGVRVMTHAGPVHARHAVLAAGAWSAGLARRLGYRIPMIAERGYHIHRGLPAGVALNRPVNDVSGGYVLVPERGGVRILSGVELARPQSPPDYRQIRAVLADVQHTLSTLPATLDAAQTGNVWMGSRPSTPDSLPVIGFARRHDRIVFAFGHGHIGLSTGPVTGQLVADLISRQPLSIPIHAFDPMRFQR